MVHNWLRLLQVTEITDIVERPSDASQPEGRYIGVPDNPDGMGGI